MCIGKLSIIGVFQFCFDECLGFGQIIGASYLIYKIIMRVVVEEMSAKRAIEVL